MKYCHNLFLGKHEAVDFYFIGFKAQVSDEDITKNIKPNPMTWLDTTCNPGITACNPGITAYNPGLSY